MKRTFAKLSALLLSTLLLATSCNNATQISFDDGSDYVKPTVSADGLTEVGIGIASAEQSSRAIYPDNWTPEAKASLVYKLFGLPVEETDTSTVDLTGDNVIFNYNKDEEILQHGSAPATIRLDPLKWNLVLVAYEKGTESSLDTTKPVLVGLKTIDLTTTNATANFCLEPYTTELANKIKTDTRIVIEKTTASRGSIDIYFNFAMPSDTDAQPATIDFELSGNGLENPITSTVESKAFGTSNSNKTAQFIQTKSVLPGTYTFKASFKNSLGNLILPYEDKIIVDAGNTSKPVGNNIYLPENAFNRKPEAPSNLNSKFTFIPKANGITRNNLVIQKAADTTNAINENMYEAKFTWKDNSVNETGFILTMTANADKNITVSYDSASKKAKIETDISEIVLSDPDSTTETMGPGCESITLKIPMGTSLSNIEIASTNSFIQDPNTLGIEKIDSGNPLAATTPIGMYQVAYKISDKTDKIKNCYVNYGPGADFKISDAESKYFVCAYEFDSKEPLASTAKSTGDTPNWPIMKNDSRTDLMFGGWSIEEKNSLKSIKTWADLKNTTEGKLETSQYNKNIILYPSWTIKQAITVSFKDYSEAKNLDVVLNHNPENLITPFNETDNKKVVIKLPSYALDGTEKFVVNGLDGKPIYTYNKAAPTPDVAGFTVAPDSALENPQGKMLTWNITKWNKNAPGGIYSIYVEYEYKGNDESTLPVTGYLYVNLEN